jgi:hypothetical protein
LILQSRWSTFPRLGANPAEIAKGHSMGPAGLEVEREILNDGELAYWLQTAISAGQTWYRL